jgi:hypothetical protein
MQHGKPQPETISMIRRHKSLIGAMWLVVCAWQPASTLSSEEVRHFYRQACGRSGWTAVSDGRITIV